VGKRKKQKERGKERRNKIERIEGKRRETVFKEMCTALCDYHSIYIQSV